MSFSAASGSHSSGDRNSPPNGRKRKLSSQASSSSHHNPSTVSNSSIASTSRTYPERSPSQSSLAPSVKRLKTSSTSNLCSSSCSQELNHSQLTKEECVNLTHQDSTNCKYLNGSDMAHQPVNKLPCAGSNHFRIHKAAGGSTTNNHSKKPGQGKKIVIKNRKSKLEYRSFPCVIKVPCDHVRVLSDPQGLITSQSSYPTV